MTDLLSYSTIAPGQTIGVLGGGQLGRMFCQAAQQLGYHVIVFENHDHSPAVQVADDKIIADYSDEQALRVFAQRCVAITTEFENVPAQSLAYLAQHCQVAPQSLAVEMTQDRIAEKDFIAQQGVPVAPYKAIYTEADLLNLESLDPEQALFPGILKLSRLGYDGKGQSVVADIQAALHAFRQMGSKPCVLERLLPLEKEISLVLVRSFDGQMVTYPVVQNIHVNGILATTIVNPLAVPNYLQTQAKKAAMTLAEALHYVGVLCVEFFVLKDGRLIVNEIAPRPHNSGHYTQNACYTSQFEQQVRALAHLPLGSTQLLQPAIMLNLLGDTWIAQHGQPAWDQVLAIPGVALHLYGKQEYRAGRKMGHINIVGSDYDEVLEKARQIASLISLQHCP